MGHLRSPCNDYHGKEITASQLVRGGLQCMGVTQYKCPSAEVRLKCIRTRPRSGILKQISRIPDSQDGTVASPTGAVGRSTRSLTRNALKAFTFLQINQRHPLKPPSMPLASCFFLLLLRPSPALPYSCSGLLLLCPIGSDGHLSPPPGPLSLDIGLALELVVTLAGRSLLSSSRSSLKDKGVLFTNNTVLIRLGYGVLPSLLPTSWSSSWDFQFGGPSPSFASSSLSSLG